MIDVAKQTSEPSPRRVSARATVVLAAAFLSLTALAGCSSVPADPVSEAPAPLATSIPMPDIGPSPAPSELTDEEIESSRLADQDKAWQDRVLSRFPEAVRIDVAFAGYLNNDEVIEKLIECYESAGVPIDIGKDAHGNVGGVEALSTTTEQAVAEFICRQENRSQPRAPINTPQLGWMYDYLTEFYVPCLAANGIDNPEPPSRADFIANWPNQGWFPSPGILPMGSDADEAIMEACPPPK